jgi:cytoskeleton protein RodZ
MNEVEMSGALPELPETTLAAAPVTAGRLLRNAREAAGLHIAALAVSMKVPVKKLEALEADRADLLPDAVFVRALASSVCRALKIDSAPILELLPQTVKPSFEAGDKGINAPFKVPGEAASVGFVDALKRPVVIVVSLLLLAVLGIAFAPEMHLPEFASKADVTPVNIAPPKEPAIEPVPVAEKLEEKLPPVEVVPGPSPAELVKQPVTEVALPASSAPVQKPTEMIVIRAKGTTWVEVVDSTGAVLVRRTLQADGITSATGVSPLAVVVGKADMVDVEVRGKPFNMSTVSRDNVARFEVK